MKKTINKLVTCMIAIFMGGFVIAAPIVAGTPVMAKCPDKMVPSAILGSGAKYYNANGEEVAQGTPGAERCVDANRDSVKDILKLVVEIMTVGIGLIGAIGITISGIQYITAGGNEEMTRKAKRRIFEIVIGFFAYVLIYAALYFLIPDFKPFS